MPHTGVLGKTIHSVRITAEKGTTFEVESVIILPHRKEVVKDAKGWPMQLICAATRGVLRVSSIRIPQNTQKDKKRLFSYPETLIGKRKKS